ncbi:unnamed protein product [Medioppia subpectinata]|uniref:histone acetyltransferase n=1 Tax=Medioppia subpectinata TaxID=1979941 RepID=A0A7R9KSV5_9ACAR|nr:unnamed protein product [Medioppia subpectinata]CAG2109225.1 unnamed protein product [Medioppia subpectinata]
MAMHQAFESSQVFSNTPLLDMEDENSGDMSVPLPEPPEPLPEPPLVMAYKGVSSVEPIGRVQTLVHACECTATGSGCTYPSCELMKKVMTHWLDCEHRATLCRPKSPDEPRCPPCEQLMELCTYHARHCHRPAGDCTVPHCLDIRRALREGQQRVLTQQIRQKRWREDIVSRLSEHLAQVQSTRGDSHAGSVGGGSDGSVLYNMSDL